MDLFLDVDRWDMDNEIAPVLFVLAAPDKLGVKVTVATLICNPDRVLLILLHHRLVFGSWNILTGIRVMLESLDGLFSIK